ncbi:MAG TPA: hypothetical protein VFV67_32270 [Actinophytocola sp.]|uniref:hypothetical protein n=1 Tax=Actinophytocola sp. TaxID=1872138 RepID=UPI002DBF13B9|nr:hypothetical protein [Actinophytocola sp.]HEU5475343.1 hypothetical protein [Actinophytocola sp.]
MRRTRRRVLACALPAVAAAVMLLTSGCGSGAAGVGPHGAGHGPAATPADAANAMPSEQLTVDQLAAEVGCTPTSPIKGADFRQANCKASGTNLILLDFDTAEGQRAWVDLSKDYGGVYLVGNRWTLSGNDRDYMLALQTRLGGALEQGSNHGQ